MATSDATLLCDVITKAARGKGDMTEGLKKYEEEVRHRREYATPLSRTACLDAHGPEIVSPDSPLVGRRAAPPIAFTLIEAA